MLGKFRVFKGSLENAAHRYDDDLYRTWLIQPENQGKSFEDFTQWLADVKSEDAGEAPDFVARFILAIS
ncbi:hypothetical protein [Neisseria sicca]|uniref:hypothetical protein n=1 Tax=Neisseria sicca TaxID=490 RepID=UPI000D303FD9|nr:hypothetical protein [Neisseria sicca]DAX33501.1 MAG TPA: hypothetical protein [Caudoviricetes sp.]